MTNETYNQVRALIVEKCPELLELKFGCEVQKYGTIFTWLHMVTDENSMSRCTYVNMKTGQLHQVLETISGVEEFHILGREPSLADVLRAIHKSNPANKTNITLESDGQFIQRTNGENPNGKASWDLSKPFSQQQPEVIEFLSTLIPIK